MTKYSPQQLIPRLCSDEPIDRVEHLLSAQQIRMLARVDESSSLSMIATLLQISLYDCILEAKTLLLRGVLLLYVRESPKKNALRPLSWEESVEQLEVLQDALQGRREHTGKTLIDVFPTPARREQWNAVQARFSASLTTLKKPDSLNSVQEELSDVKVSSEGVAPTLPELPTFFGGRQERKHRANGGVLPTPPMIKAFGEAPVQDGSQSHTLSSMELPSFSQLAHCSKDMVKEEPDIASVSSLDGVDSAGEYGMERDTEDEKARKIRQIREGR